MKKITRISILASALFIAGHANAQLSSDQPAMTPAQVQQLQRPQKVTRAVPTVQTASSSVESNGAAAGAKTTIKTVIIPSQGGVVPSDRPIPDTKPVMVPAQEEKPKEMEKKNN